MDEKILIEQLKQISPQAIILFGSGSRGKRTLDSDYDFLVIKDTSKSFADRIREVHSILKTNIAVDVIVVTPQEAKDLPKKSIFFQRSFKKESSFMDEYKLWLQKAKEDLRKISNL